MSASLLTCWFAHPIRVVFLYFDLIVCCCCCLNLTRQKKHARARVHIHTHTRARARTRTRARARPRPRKARQGKARQSKTRQGKERLPLFLDNFCPELKCVTGHRHLQGCASVCLLHTADCASSHMPLLQIEDLSWKMYSKLLVWETKLLLTSPIFSLDFVC